MTSALLTPILLHLPPPASPLPPLECSRVGILALWLLHFLPLGLLAPLGQALGMFAYVFVPKRRRIARTNLRLCFPELNTSAREQLLRRHFRAFGRAILESGIAWWGTPERACGTQCGWSARSMQMPSTANP